MPSPFHQTRQNRTSPHRCNQVPELSCFPCCCHDTSKFPVVKRLSNAYWHREGRRGALCAGPLPCPRRRAQYLPDRYAADESAILRTVNAMMDQLCIVVSSYNNAALLPDCLRSVAAAHPGIPTTVYVVDAGSTDGTAAIVRRDFPDVRLRVAAENRGYAALNNLALARDRRGCAGGRGPDARRRAAAQRGHGDAAGRADRAARPPGGAPGGGRHRAEDRPARRLARSRLPPLLPDAANAFWKLTGMAARYPRSPRFAQYNLTYHDPDEAIEMDSGMGACLLVRLAAIDDAGLMDERFFMYGEDLDWCYRIKQRRVARPLRAARAHPALQRLVEPPAQRPRHARLLRRDVALPPAALRADDRPAAQSAHLLSASARGASSRCWQISCGPRSKRRVASAPAGAGGSTERYNDCQRLRQMSIAPCTRLTAYRLLPATAYVHMFSCDVAGEMV